MLQFILNTSHNIIIKHIIARKKVVYQHRFPLTAKEGTYIYGCQYVRKRKTEQRTSELMLPST